MCGCDVTVETALFPGLKIGLDRVFEPEEDTDDLEGVQEKRI